MGANPIGWESFEQLLTDALAMLGEGRLKLALTDEQKSAITRRVITWYGTYLAPRRLTWPDTTGDGVYLMPDDCDFPLNVISTPASEELFEIYGGGTGYSILYDPLPIAVFRGDYSYVLQILQDVEMGKRIMSADMTWDYERSTRKLRVYPAGRNHPWRIAVEYLSSSLDFKDVDLQDQDLVFKKMQTEAKMTVGLMRRKYAEWPGPGESVTMDGDALVGEAIEERRDLDEEILAKSRPAGFIVG